MAPHLGLPLDKLLEKLKYNHVLRTACGLYKNEIPSVASLYNLIYRITGKEKEPTTKAFKRKPKIKLAKGQKLPPKHPNITKKLADKLILGRMFKDTLAEAINSILALSLRQSYELGLISPNINISGDGTCMETGASHYGKKTCGCKDNGIFNCECPRRFSDPSATWGWYSHNEHTFYASIPGTSFQQHTTHYER